MKRAAGTGRSDRPEARVRAATRFISAWLILALTVAFWAGTVCPGSAQGIKVELRPAGEPRLAASIAEKAERVTRRLENEFGLSPGQPPVIIAASTMEEFNRAQPGRRPAPPWAAGLAYPELNLIIVKTPRLVPGLDLDRVLGHELAHLVLGRLFQGRSVPRWLNEGLTMHLSDDWGISRQTAMIRAIASNRLIPLEDLVDGFPTDRVDAETAYAESFYLVAFLRDRRGPAVLGRLAKSLSLGATPRHALFEATGLWGSALEDEFHDWLRKRFTVYWVLTSPGFLWGLAALLLAAAALARRRAAARKLAAWEAEEDGQDGDPDRPGGPGPTSGPDRPL